jgi:predicted ArsR family transcriptional regulator
MRQTSLEAYLLVKKDLSKRQTQVLEAVKRRQPCNYLTLCTELGLYPNSVTPRLGELVKKEKIVESYVKAGPTGKRMTYYRVSKNDEATDLG